MPNGTPNLENESNIAFLYRMKERDQITLGLLNEFRNDSLQYLQNFIEQIESFLTNETQESAIDYINRFFDFNESQDKNNPLIYKLADLGKVRDILINAMVNEPPQEILSQQKTQECIKFCEEQTFGLAFADNVSQQSKTIFFQQACEEYFSEYFTRQGKEIEKFKELYETGKLYCPPGGVHSWEANLQWLLDRFKNNTKFVIMSRVDEDSRKRTSSIDGSGFSREIATCFKSGYRFEKDGNEIVMKHLDTVTLQNLNIDDLRMTETEGAIEFTKAIENYNLLLQGSHLAALATQLATSEIDNPSSNPSTTKSSQPEEQAQFNLQPNTRKRSRSPSPK